MKREFNYSFKIIKSSWGIFIDLHGKVTPFQDQKCYQYHGINTGIHCDFSHDINYYEKIYILKGVCFFCDHILKDHRKINDKIVFEKVSYNPCDFQNEGLIVATIRCLSTLFNFRLPSIETRFDRTANKYTFWYCDVEIK